MKKLYKKGTVHPTPPFIISDNLSFLPAAIFTLTAALSLQDKQVLAYLLSCSSNNHVSKRNNITRTTTSGGGAWGGGGAGGDHPPCFNCCCFECYMSYWVKWDASPNRQLIHEIIDAFEEGLSSMEVIKKEKSKRERRKSRGNRGGGGGGGSEVSKDEFSESDSVVERCSTTITTSGGGGGEREEMVEKGSVRRIVGFLGEKIWGVLELM